MDLQILDILFSRSDTHSAFLCITIVFGIYE